MLERLEPGWRTHLMFAEFDGLVHEAADHLVVRSPASPRYYWGNFLLFDRLATSTDLGPWMQAFDAAIARPQPASGHVAFGMHAHAETWQAPAAFTAAGFEAFATTTLVLHRGGLRPAAPPRGVAAELRPLPLPAQAADLVDLSAACNDDGYADAAYRAFRADQMRRYGAMAAAGLGHWFGAVVQGRPVAALGLFGRDGMGRFQHVETHPRWRRRGLCRALVHQACMHGFDRRGWDTLVMCADPDDVAIGIYESLGFERQSTQWSLQRRAPADCPAPAAPAGPDAD